MTELERTTFSDGFRLCLLETWQDAANGNMMAVQVKLFDGGRQQKVFRHFPGDAKTPFPAENIAAIIYQVITTPHVLVVYGRGWLGLLHSLFAERLALFRILDLHATAIALRQDLKPRAATAELYKAYAIPHSTGETLLFSDEIERLLWAVIAEAGQRGFSWDDLLHAAERARHRADFSRCAFNLSSLTAIPPRPGVYIMFDEKGRCLYVGKSVNLQRRLSEYFQNALRLPDKIANIRSSIHRIEYRLVGSELEALLLEHRFIRATQPQLNVQRQIKEAGSRYHAPALPILLITAAAQPEYASAFVLGGSRFLYQINFKPARKPAESLLKLLQHAVENGAAPRPNRALRSWGFDGAEIATRYFHANRHRLHWCSPDADFLKKDWWTLVCNMAKAALLEPESAAEYRDLHADSVDSAD